MAHLVFNSFPRSGNVFLTNIAGHAFDVDISAAHMPEIFKVPELCNVSVFRRPKDAIASLIYKTRENSPEVAQGVSSDLKYVPDIVDSAVAKYDAYITEAAKYLDLIQVLVFEDIIENYAGAIQSIANKFSLDIRDGYANNIVIDRSSNIWSNKYDGHAPRDKDCIRVEIENIVSELDSVKDLTIRYSEFLSNI